MPKLTSSQRFSGLQSSEPKDNRGAVGARVEALAALHRGEGVREEFHLAQARLCGEMR